MVIARRVASVGTNRRSVSSCATPSGWGCCGTRRATTTSASRFVPVELWEAAQKTLRGPDGKRTGRKTQRFLLGNGLLRCGACGSAMIVRRDRKNYGYYEVYLCGGRTSGATNCTQGAVQRAALD